MPASAATESCEGPSFRPCCRHCTRHSAVVSLPYRQTSRRCAIRDDESDRVIVANLIEDTVLADADPPDAVALRSAEQLRSAGPWVARKSADRTAELGLGLGLDPSKLSIGSR